MRRILVMSALAFVCITVSNASPVNGFYEIEASGPDEALQWRLADAEASQQGGRLLLLNPGQHRPGMVGESGRNTWLLLPGASIAGGGPAMTDGSALNGNSGIVVARYQTEPRNENTMFVSTRIARGDPLISSYQKNAVYVRLIQDDGSSYTPSRGDVGDSDLRSHDGVGVESQAVIADGNHAGRVWSYHGITRVQHDADGRAVVAEFESLNNASEQPAANRRDAKIGVHVVARGTANSTAGVYIASSEGRTWHDGIVIDSRATAASALAVRDSARPGIVNVAVIGSDGSARFHSVTSGGRPVATVAFGPTTSRPAMLGLADTGTFYFDTTLRRPVWWAGRTWVDAEGHDV